MRSGCGLAARGSAGAVVIASACGRTSYDAPGAESMGGSSVSGGSGGLESEPPGGAGAAVGGTGESKTAGNYAASLLAAEEAKEKGFTQVLWLDAAARKYVEEVGTMNMFFVIDDEVITAPLTGSILPGITWDSAFRLVKDWGMKVSERFLAIDEVIDAAKDGRLKEAFGTGTAAVISPVGQITFKGKHHIVSDGKMGELSQRLYNEIVGIQYAEKEDPYEWREKIG